MKTSPTPHDLLFKKFFSDITVVTDFLEIHLPPALREYVQKHIRERDINVRLRDIAFLLELTQPNKEQVACLLHYLAQEANTLDSEAFFRNLGQKTTGYQEEIMTIAEQLEQKGRSIGLQEGRSERDNEIARKMLAMGLDRATIELATGLSGQELDALAM